MRAPWLALLVAACGTSPSHVDTAADAIVEPSPGRAVCGWKDTAQATDITHINASGTASGAAPGPTVLALDVAPEAPFARVREALAPHAPHVVRLDVVVEGRWLVPLTFAGRAAPIEGETVETIVGHRRVIRPKAAPRLRFADIRVDGDEVQVFVENDRVGGTRVALDDLAQALDAIDPPVSAFALTATDATRWSQLVRALVATACFDRGPGAEPHEVLLDERPPPGGSSPP